MSCRLTWAWDNEETGKFRKLLGKRRVLFKPVLPHVYLPCTGDVRTARMLTYALSQFDCDTKRGKVKLRRGM